MTYDEFKKAVSDRFTPAELIEMLDITTAELLEILEDSPYLMYDDNAILDIKEMMGIDDD